MSWVGMRYKKGKPHLLTKRFFVFNLSFQDVSEIRCLVLRTEHRHTKLCWVPSSPSGYLPSKTISVSLNFYHTDMMVRGSCYFVCSGSKEEAWKIGNTCLLEAATRYIQRLLQEDRILFYFSFRTKHCHWIWQFLHGFPYATAGCRSQFRLHITLNSRENFGTKIKQIQGLTAQ